MKVAVRYFASVREALGPGEEIEIGGGSDIAALRDALIARGAEPVVADPLYDDGELRALGFEPWDGREAAGAILQADHAGYTALGPSDLPGVRAVVDGRGLLDSARFAAAGVALRRIGGG